MAKAQRKSTKAAPVEAARKLQAHAGGATHDFDRIIHERLRLGIVSALAAMSAGFVPGLMLLAASLFGMLIGLIFVRIAAEFVLIVFRINEHLGAIRARGGM